MHKLRSGNARSPPPPQMIHTRFHLGLGKCCATPLLKPSYTTDSVSFESGEKKGGGGALRNFPVFAFSIKRWEKWESLIQTQIRLEF